MNAKVEEQEPLLGRCRDVRVGGCRSDDIIRNFHKFNIFKFAVNDNIITTHKHFVTTTLPTSLHP